MHSTVVLIITILSLSAFGARMPKTQRVYQSIDFKDDMDLVNMNKAIDRQLKQFESTNLNESFKLGTLTYTRKDLKNSLIDFKLLVQETQKCLNSFPEADCYSNLSTQLNASFRIYRPLPDSTERGYQTGQTLFTAYYSPDLHGSKVKTDVYKHAIYGLPQTEALRRLTREQIDFEGGLEGQGLELFYVKESLYDIWLLHVEGGGRVQVENPDGTISMHYLSYANSNSQPFRMLYRYMIDNGMLVPGQASIAHQRAYLENNPQDVRRVMSSTPSYIYFKVTLDEPLGVRNIPLTENRSLATDYRRYQEYGLINFIQAKMPIAIDEEGLVNTKDFSRFMLNQDTGGAIRGTARSDLYFGFGSNAEFVANHLNHLGFQYFLIKK